METTEIPTSLVSTHRIDDFATGDTRIVVRFRSVFAIIVPREWVEDEHDAGRLDAESRIIDLAVARLLSNLSTYAVMEGEHALVVDFRELLLDEEKADA